MHQNIQVCLNFIALGFVLDTLFFCDTGKGKKKNTEKRAYTKAACLRATKGVEPQRIT